MAAEGLDGMHQGRTERVTGELSSYEIPLNSSHDIRIQDGWWQYMSVHDDMAAHMAGHHVAGGRVRTCAIRC